MISKELQASVTEIIHAGDSQTMVSKMMSFSHLDDGKQKGNIGPTLDPPELEKQNRKH